MTSFTKQVRAGLRTAARENIDEVPVAMDPAQIDATLAEPVAAEIEQEIVAPAGEIEQGTAALAEASTDADTLENAASILEGAVGETAPDVDVATSELANITVEAISRKYNLPRGTKISKESFGTADARKAMARQLSKEAMDKAGELRKRVSDGIAKLIEWFKNLVKNVFDKRTKLEKRFQAILASAKAKKGFKVKEGVKIKLDPSMANSKASDVIDVLGGFKEIAEIAGTNAAEIEGMGSRPEFDFNPKKLGGVVLKAGVTDGKLVVVKGPAEVSVPEEIDPVELERVESMATTGLSLLKDLKTAEAEFSKVIASMGTASQKLKALATGEDNGAGASRGAILARYQGVSTLAGSLSTIVLRFLATMSTACEQNLAAYEAPAAA